MGEDSQNLHKIDDDLASHRSVSSILRECMAPRETRKTILRKREMLRDFKRKLKTLERPLVNEIKFIDGQCLPGTQGLIRLSEYVDQNKSNE